VSSCEKCWSDAGGDATRYIALIRERFPRQCTPEEQAGPDAAQCPHCKRMTLHQHTGEPMCRCPESAPWTHRRLASAGIRVGSARTGTALLAIGRTSGNERKRASRAGTGTRSGTRTANASSARRRAAARWRNLTRLANADMRAGGTLAGTASSVLRRVGRVARKRKRTRRASVGTRAGVFQAAVTASSATRSAGGRTEACRWRRTRALKYAKCLVARKKPNASSTAM